MMTTITGARRTTLSRVENRRILIGVDTGGTFTDLVAVDEVSGRLVTTKTPSTPADPAEGFMTGIEKVLVLMQAGAGDVVAVSHGTTVATNQLLEGRGLAALGFITTEGYESILEIARQSVPDGYGNSYFWVKPPRIVPADRVATVRGRMDFRGQEIRPFDGEQARAAARWFRDHGITTIGVCFLHSYANPAHEQAMREVLSVEHPEAVVSISSDVLREYREYERSMTTLIDAAVKPRMARYVAGIRRRLDEVAPALPFHVMKSNGGVISADQVVAQPIATVLSGPAAGALGAGRVATAAGVDLVLTLDGGGTSTDVAVLVGGEPTLTTEGSVGEYPSRIPMIDVVTVGAGGGSVAWRSPEGALKVGPRSAGADPGPMCYGKGGVEPTVTDAHLVLGRIPTHLLGGEIPLDVAAAAQGIAELAGAAGISLEHAATGILEVSAWNQANALRQVSVARGLDVRDFTLVTFGGSGSLLACRLVDVLGLAGVLVPTNPGNLSAFGLLTVDVRLDYVRTWVAPDADLDLDVVNHLFDELAEQSRAALLTEGFGREQHRTVRSADLRYAGQAYEVRVAVPDGPLDRAEADRVVEAFHDAHAARYGYSFRGDAAQRVEWVNLRVTGIGPIPHPELRRLTLGGTGRPPGTGPTPSGVRPALFDLQQGWVSTGVYQRAGLEPGDQISGPAVVEEYGSTVPVHPGFTARVDPFGNLLLHKEVAR